MTGRLAREAGLERTVQGQSIARPATRTPQSRVRVRARGPVRRHSPSLHDLVAVTSRALVHTSAPVLRATARRRRRFASRVSGSRKGGDDGRARIHFLRCEQRRRHLARRGKPSERTAAATSDHCRCRHGTVRRGIARSIFICVVLGGRSRTRLSVALTARAMFDHSRSLRSCASEDETR